MSRELPWIIKYRPRSLKDYVNQEEAKEKLVEWLKKFPDVGAKALLLYGPPGTGKTSLVECAARDLGFEILEMNASDFRRLEDIERVAISAADKRSLWGGRRLILLDEVDGINARADQGGLEALLRLVEITRAPVVMTANDPWGQSLRPLRTIAIMVEVKKLSEGNVIRILRSICSSEGVECDDDALKEIARRSEGDLRSAINDLEAVARGRRRVSLEGVRSVLGYRDRERSPFETLGRIFSAKYAWQARLAASNTQLDSEMLLQWISENVPAQLEDPEDLWRAYEALSRASIYMGRIVRSGSWDLLSYSVEMMSAGVAMARKNSKPKWVGYKFPARIRQLSATREAREVRDSLASIIASAAHVSRSTARIDYIPFLAAIFRSNPEEAARLALGLRISDSMIEYLAGPSAKEVISLVRELEKKRSQQASRAPPPSGRPSERAERPGPRAERRGGEAPRKGGGLDRFVR